MENNLRERRRRCRSTRPSIVVGGIADVRTDEELEDPWYVPSHYRQFSCTLGMERLDGHPNVETLITFRLENMGHSVLSDVVEAVVKGARYAAGDRATFAHSDAFREPYTVEFRASENVYGPCLRAVVLGIEEELQALPTAEADALIASHDPLIDPCDTI